MSALYQVFSSGLSYVWSPSSINASQSAAAASEPLERPHSVDFQESVQLHDESPSVNLRHFTAHPNAQTSEMPLYEIGSLFSRQQQESAAASSQQEMSHSNQSEEIDYAHLDTLFPEKNLVNKPQTMTAAQVAHIVKLLSPAAYTPAAACASSSSIDDRLGDFEQKILSGIGIRTICMTAAEKSRYCLAQLRVQLFKEKNINLHLAHIDSAIEKAPLLAHADLYRIRAEHHLKTENYKDAERDLKISIMMKRTPEALVHLASILAFHSKEPKLGEAYCLLTEVMNAPIVMNTKEVNAQCLQTQLLIVSKLKEHVDKNTLSALDACVLTLHFEEFKELAIEKICSEKTFPQYIHSQCFNSFCDVIEKDFNFQLANGSYALGLLHQRLRCSYVCEKAPKTLIESVTTNMFDHFRTAAQFNHAQANLELGCCYFQLGCQMGLTNAEMRKQATLFLERAVDLQEPSAKQKIVEYKLEKYLSKKQTN